MNVKAYLVKHHQPLNSMAEIQTKVLQII